MQSPPPPPQPNVFVVAELREKFDNGEDPLDPERNSGGGGFHGNPFGFGNGGGFTFKFNFN